MRARAVDKEKARKQEEILKGLIRQEQIRERARQKAERISSAQELVRELINENAVDKKGYMSNEEVRSLFTMLQKTKTERDVEKAIAEVEYRAARAETKELMKAVESIILDKYVRTKNGVKTPLKVDPETAAYLQAAKEYFIRFDKVYNRRDAMGNPISSEERSRSFFNEVDLVFAERDVAQSIVNAMDSGDIEMNERVYNDAQNKIDAINIAIKAYRVKRGLDQSNLQNAIVNGIRQGMVMNVNRRWAQEILEQLQSDMDGGRQALKEDKDRRKAERRERLDTAIEDISRTRSSSTRFDRTTDSESTLARRGLSTAERWMNTHMDINNLLNAMSFNNGKMSEMGEDLQRGEMAMREMRREKENMIKEAHVQIFGKDHAKVINEIRKAAPISFAVQSATRVSRVELSQFQAMYLYNHWKTESSRENIARLIAPEIDENSVEQPNMTLAEQRMAEIEAYLDPRVKLYADWKTNVFYPSFREAVGKTYTDIYGTPIDFEEMYSGQLLLQGSETSSEDPLGDIQSSFGMRPAVPGPIKSRTGSNRKIMAVDDEIATYRYISDISRWTHMSVPYKNLEQVLKSSEFIAASTRNNLEDHRTKALGLMQKYMIPHKAEDVEKVLNEIANRYYTAKLALTIPTALKQVTSVVFAPAADPTGISNHFSTFFSLLGDAKRRGEVFRIIKSESSLLYERYNSEDAFMRSISDIVDNDRMTVTPKSPLSEKLEWIRKNSLFHVKWGDRVAVLGMFAIYESVYQQELAKHNNHEAAHKEALFQYEYAVKKTQQSSSALDKDLVQLGGATRFSSAFMTAQKQQLREEIESVRGIARSMKGQGYVSRSAGQNLYRLTANHVLVPVMVELLTEAAFAMMWSDDEERDQEVWKRAVRAGVVGNTNSIFLLGKVIDFGSRAVIHGDENRWYEKDLAIALMPSIEGVGDFSESLFRFTREQSMENFVGFVMELFSVTGYGAENALRWLENLYNVTDAEDGAEFIMRVLNYSESMLEEWGYDGKAVNSGQINPINPLNSRPSVAPVAPIAPPPPVAPRIPMN
jgi:hypothetical protein